jgi:hypothetical protein
MSDHQSFKLTVTGSGVLKDGTTFSRNLQIKEVVGRSTAIEVSIKAYFSYLLT